MAVARRDAADRSSPPPPPALRPYLRFRGLPERARSAVRDALDSDDGFRARVVERAADALSGDGTGADEASQLFLVRPEGWRRDLDALVDAAAEATTREQAEREESSARRRVEQLEAAVARLREELAAAGAEAERLGGALDREQARRRDLAGQVDAATGERGRLEEERSAAVRQLADARALAESRLEERRAADARADAAAARADAADQVAEQLRAELSSRSVRHLQDLDPDSEEQNDRGRDGSAVPPGLGDAVAALERAAASAGSLGAELRRVADALRPAPSTPAIGGPAGPGAAATTPAPPAPPAVPGTPSAVRGRVAHRRRPRVQLRRGAVDGTPEATRQYLSAAGVVVLVDGYNVSMTAWPELAAAPQREALIGLLGELARRHGAEIHVVFDGDAEGGRPSVHAPLDVRVHFSPAEVEADDVVVELAGRVDTGRPVVVVSSDHRVREGARRAGAAVVGSADLLALRGA